MSGALFVLLVWCIFALVKFFGTGASKKLGNPPTEFNWRDNVLKSVPPVSKHVDFLENDPLLG